MYFVFSCGSAQDGEASGGLGDMKFRADTIRAAMDFADAESPEYLSTEILDGASGAVWATNRHGEWEAYSLPIN